MARIAPIPPREWPEGMRAALAALRPPDAHLPALRREGGPKGLNVLGTLAWHPQLARAFHTFNGHILATSTLSPRQRELLVLRVAALRGSDYEWRQHAVIASDAGISDQEVARVRAGPADPGWSDLEAAMLRSVDELLADARISESTWAALSRELGVQQLMDTVFTVGAYETLAMALRSFDVELDDDLTAGDRPGGPAD